MASKTSSKDDYRYHGWACMMDGSSSHSCTQLCHIFVLFFYPILQLALTSVFWVIILG